MKESFKPSRRKLLKLLGLGAGAFLINAVTGPLTGGGALSSSGNLGGRSLLRRRSNGLSISLTERFEDKKRGLSFYYPSNYMLKEFSEKGGGKTFVFEDPEGFNGFQLFVTTYYEDHITEERMSLDIPSGVVRAIEKKRVGVNKDISAVSFYSEDRTIGDTFEGWLIRDKYIFEFTTYGDLDGVLNRVLDTLEYKNVLV